VVPASSTFIKEKFAEYYRENQSFVLSPSAVGKREFGFALFEGQMVRHRCFSREEELKSFLQACVPSDAYFSCAYYESPEAEMDKKGWLGADLVFDIDADHIETPCGKVHDVWTCGGCGFEGKGIVPEKCPVCGGERFIVKTWPCEECLESAKRETIKLLDMLLEDFGFSEKELYAFFSGHRGYHVHVEAESARTLDAVARKEIVDYVCAVGLDTGFNASSTSSSARPSLPIAPRLEDPGWRGRIARRMYNLILKGEAEDYVRLGLKRNVVEAIVRNRETILKSWDSVGPYRAVRGVGFESWGRIVDSCVNSLSAKVDTVVTTDTHRLIRLAGALHGKTGLRKTWFPISRIENFDPFEQAVAFRNGTARVFVSEAPEFTLGGEAFGPYRNEKVELPTAAAVLLVCKKRAEITE
jgi:DNA primase small subunit